MNILKLVLCCFVICACKQAPSNSTEQSFKNTQLEGSVFGTFYQVTYDTDANYEVQLDSLFAVINTSMSTYIDNSDISKLNRNELIDVDNHFKTVFSNSEAIYKATNGAFDPTIGAVVNAWDFGPEGKIMDLDSLKINTLMQSVGLDKVSLKGNKIIKPEGTFIDFNAIAKGYG